MQKHNVPWKAEWKAAGLDSGPLTLEEERLAEDLKKENEAFLRAHPWNPRGRSQAPRRTMLTWSPLLAAAALAAAFGLFPLGGTEHIKGNADPVLSVYRQAPSGNEKLQAGSLVRAGDVLQAAYRVSGAAQGVVLSVDGNRNVTVHLARDGHSVELKPGAEQPLDSSYELDQAPRFEVFLLIVGPRAFEVEPLREVLKKTAWENLRPDAFGKELVYQTLALKKGGGK